MEREVKTSTKVKALYNWLNGYWSMQTICSVCKVGNEVVVGWLFEMQQAWKQARVHFNPYDVREANVRRQEHERQVKVQKKLAEQEKKEKAKALVPDREDRIALIRQRYLNNQYNTWELSQELGVSMSTIRKDFAEYKRRVKARGYKKQEMTNEVRR